MVRAHRTSTSRSPTPTATRSTSRRCSPRATSQTRPNGPTGGCCSAPMVHYPTDDAARARRPRRRRRHAGRRRRRRAADRPPPGRRHDRQRQGPVGRRALHRPARSRRRLAGLGLSADPTPLRLVQVGTDAVDVPTVRLLAHRARLRARHPSVHRRRPRPPQLAVPLFFQPMSAGDTARRAQRNRTHIDVFVPDDRAEAHVAAAVAAGGHAATTPKRRSGGRSAIRKATRSTSRVAVGRRGAPGSPPGALTCRSDRVGLGLPDPVVQAGLRRRRGASAVRRRTVSGPRRRRRTRAPRRRRGRDGLAVTRIRAMPSALRAVDEIVDQRPPDAGSRIDDGSTNSASSSSSSSTGRGGEADDAAVVDRDTGPSLAQRCRVVLRACRGWRGCAHDRRRSPVRSRRRTSRTSWWSASSAVRITTPTTPSVSERSGRRRPSCRSRRCHHHQPDEPRGAAGGPRSRGRTGATTGAVRSWRRRGARRSRGAARRPDRRSSARSGRRWRRGGRRRTRPARTIVSISSGV